MDYLKYFIQKFKKNIKKYSSKDNLIYQIIHKNRKFIIFLVLLSLIASFSELIFLENLPKLLDNLLEKRNVDKFFLSNMLLTVTLWSFLGIFVRYKIVSLMATLSKDLTELVVINFSNLSIKKIEKIGKTKISVLTTINLDNIIYGVCNPLMRLVEQFFTIVVGIYVIYLYFGQKSIVFLIFAFLLIISLVFSTRKKSYEYGLVEVNKNKSVFYLISLFMENIREILLQGNYTYYSDPMSKENYQKLIATGNARFLSDLPRRIIESILYFSICFVAIFGLLDSGEIVSNISSLSVMLLILQRISPLVNQAYQAIFSIFNNLPIISEYEILNSYSLFREKYKSNEIKPKAYKEKRTIKSINLRNLSVGHLIETPLLLIPSLSIHINEPIAIMGQSGLGKSTLVETIIGLRHPLSGSCDFLDNQGLVVKNFKSISYIPQNSQVSGRTMFEMLSFGNPNLKKYEKDKKIKSQIINILKVCCIWDDFIYSFDELFNNIGEGATSLSGGQKQRLTLARALLQNKNILIFDESTNGLNNYLEKKIVSNIINTQSKIIIFITHNEDLVSIFRNVINLKDYSIK